MKVSKRSTQSVAPAAKRNRPLTALGAHIYAGGFSLGVKAAGFQLLGHLEEWNFGVETSRKNLDIPVWTPQTAWDEPIAELRGKVDWLYTNPPCASWSNAGVKVSDKTKNVGRWRSDDRTHCTERCFGLIPQLNPTVFTWESVAAAKKNGAGFVAERTQEMQTAGFHVYHLLFDGYDTGLPQHRKRFFFVASKVKLDFKKGTTPGKTVREALAVLKSKGPGPMGNLLDMHRVLLKKMKGESGLLWRKFARLNDGQEFKRDEKTGYVKGRPGFLHRKIEWDKPSPTITGSMHLYHPDEVRGMSVKEMQVLCSYPPDYEFVGGVSAQYSQIAKAVLPAPAKWLATQVMAGLKRGEKIKPGLTEHDFIKGDR